MDPVLGTNNPHPDPQLHTPLRVFLHTHSVYTHTPQGLPHHSVYTHTPQGVSPFCVAHAPQGLPPLCVRMPLRLCPTFCVCTCSSGSPLPFHVYTCSSGSVPPPNCVAPSPLFLSLLFLDGSGVGGAEGV